MQSIKKPTKSLKTFRLSLALLVSTSFVACDTKPLTEFKDKTPAIETSIDSELEQQLGLDYKNFPAAQRSLEQQIQQLTALEKLTELELDIDVSIRVEGTQAPDSQIRFAREEYVAPGKDYIASNPQIFFDSLNFRMNQVLQPPYSTIQLMGQGSQVHKVPNSHYQISKAEIAEINFLNGEKSEEILADKNARSDLALFKKANGKVIENLSANIEFEYPVEYLEFVLNDAKPATNFGDYKIIFKRLAADQFRLTYSAEIKDSVIEIFALHENGRALERKKRIGKTLPDAVTLSYLKQANQHYQKTLKKLRLGEFESALALQNYVNSNMPAEPELVVSNVIDSMTYYGPIQEVNLVVKSASTKTIRKNWLIRNESILDNLTGFYPAFDSASKKYGLVDSLGEWQIPPTYGDLRFNSDNFFENTYTKQHYLLEKQGKTLNAIDYRPRRKLSEKGMLVDKVTAKSIDADGRPMRGILNLSTNELMIPIEFYSIEMDDNYFIAEKDRTETLSWYLIYNNEGTSILPVGNYAEIKVENDFIYATTPIENKDPIRKAFDQNGNKITPDGWTALGQFGDDNLLLVQRCKTVKDPDVDYYRKKCEYQFTDKKGNIAINLENFDYADVSTFSNGYAAIANKKNLMGYIDTKGKLVIPFRYTRAGRFHKKYALVTEKNGDEKLIDAKNRVFKNFKNQIKQHQYGYADEDIYLMKDGSRYNGNGEKLLPKAGLND